MKILLRRMFECPPIDRWRRFEALLKDCLLELGNTITELEFDPGFPPDPPGFDFKIYPHKTRREISGVDLFHKEMHIKGLFTIDPLGWGADHSRSLHPPDLTSIPAQEAARFCESMRTDFQRSGISKHNQPALRPLEPAFEPYLLAPLQLPTDDTIMHHSPLGVIDYIHLLSNWAESSGRKVVFKIHPGSHMPEVKAAVLGRASDSPCVFVVDENIHGLIAHSQGVVVINSGVGFESLIHGKPVVTLGACDYQWATFRAQAGTLDQAYDWICGHPEEQKLLGYQLIYHYFHRHAYPTLPAVEPVTRLRLMTFLRGYFANGCNVPV